jgi:hypothetical protein
MTMSRTQYLPAMHVVHKIENLITSSSILHFQLHLFDQMQAVPKTMSYAMLKPYQMTIMPYPKENTIIINHTIRQNQIPSTSVSSVSGPLPSSLPSLSVLGPGICA